ncbi:MAG: hypothetical protein IJ746_03340 [Ruminococcus sp.]|nr:hypothetical protein [Ruminococcus sp.]
MKRIWFFLISLCLIFASTRSRDTVASQERAMVHAVGIDREEDGYRVTLQVFRPEGSGPDTQLDAAKSNVFCISDKGETVEEALLRCEDRLGEFLFLGHDQLIVLGQDADLTDPRGLFSYFLRGRECYLGVRVISADCEAARLLKAELSEGAVAAENLVDVADRHYKNSSTVRCDLLGLLNSCELGCAVVPLAEPRSADGTAADSESEGGDSGSGSDKEGESKKEGDTVSAAGAAVFVDGRRSFELEPRLCGALNCLLGGRESELLQLSGRRGPVSVTLRHEGAETSYDIKDGRVRCRFDIKLSVIADNTTEAEFPPSDLCRQAEEAVLDQCRALTDTAYSEGADVLGIAAAIRQRFPKFYRAHSSDPRELASLCDFEFEVSCTAR